MTDTTPAVGPDDMPRPGAALELPRVPKQERSRRKREALLDAAERLFSERAFEDVAVTDITEAAGYPPTTFYNYFVGKSQAVILIAERYFGTLAPVMNPLTVALAEGGHPRDAIRASMAPLFDSWLDLPWLRRTWRQLTLTDPVVAAYQERLNERWEAGLSAVLEAAAGAGALHPAEARPTATVLRALVDGVVDEVVIRGAPSRDEALDTLADLLYRGLLTEDFRRRLAAE